MINKSIIIKKFKSFDERLKDFSDRYSVPLYTNSISFNFKTNLYYIR